MEQVKSLENFEKELGDFLSPYINKIEELDFPDEHDFYGIVESCEDLIKRLNKKAVG